MTSESKSMRIMTYVLALTVFIGIGLQVARRETRHSPAYFEAQKLQQMVDWKAAIPFYNKALQENPYDAICLAERGFAYAQVGKYWLAYGDFREATKIDINCWDAYSRRAAVSNWLGLTTLARKDAERALEIMPEPPEDRNILLAHGILLQMVKKDEQASKELNRALSKTKGDYSKDAFITKVNALFKLKKYSEAMSELNGLMLLGSAKNMYFLMRGNIYLWQGKYDLACKDFEYYSFKEPYDPRGNFGVGICYDKLNKSRWGSKCFEEAYKKAPNYLYAYLESERIFTTARLYHRALPCISKVIELEPNQAWYFARRAFVYCNLKEWKKAKKDAETAIRLDPTFEFSYTYLSWANQNLGDQTSAIAELNKAVEIAPKSAAMYYARALYYREKKIYPRAIEDFDRAIAINAKDPSFFCARGSALLSSGKYKEAISSCSESIRIDPDRSHPYFSRGSAYARIGEYQLALKDLSYCVTEFPDYGEAWYERSKVYKALGNEGQAKSDMVKAEKFGYGHPEAM